MHLDPAEAREYLQRFLAAVAPRSGRELWFFPGSVAIEASAQACRSRADIRIGIQDVHWEPKGAFTGAVSVGMARGAGASMALVGHSERRHVFGESEADTRKKVRALLDAAMGIVLCVGEKLEERERGETGAVVLRQLAAAIDGLAKEELSRLVIAYEPVWAIGTGRHATPADAADVHRVIRGHLTARGAPTNTILYGGSVNLSNIRALLAEPEINGVLVGGASLDPERWAEIVETNA